MKILLVLFLSVFSFNSFGNIKFQSIESDTVYGEKELVEFLVLELNSFPKTDTVKSHKVKLIAVGLALTLGVFGVHRLYLGTKPLVPIAYTLTLGGGMGLLPIIDIFYIITAKDINSIRNNDHVFIWNKNKSK